MEIIATSEVVATHLFGGESNPYYAEPSKRLAQVKIMRNVEGRYMIILRPARYVPATGNIVSDHFPIFSVVRDTEEQARTVANLAWTFGRDCMTGQIGSGDREGLLALGIDSWERHTVCPKCDRLDTLSTALESYGDRTECSACDHNDWHSIGD